jgi:hypothetical protein
MRRMYLAAALAAGLALSACATDSLSLAGPSPVATAAAHTSADEKARATAHLAYNSAARAVILTKKIGQLSPAAKAAAKHYLGHGGVLYLADRAVEDAYQAGNTSDLSAQAASTLRLAGELKALLPAAAVKQAEAEAR